ncbi:MAG: redoxin domain-containing protein [Fuerstiella sp.]|nr:redoxin domain-containing protein [Fuerstiella sp.]MCP4786913.1 redoxin domain-containing protein [Fuerstiella sp.]MCP4858339.1 redoxin domain-containing protein [Fuerstiella sp.]
MILPLSAAVIAALCGWRIMNPGGLSDSAATQPEMRQPAPAIQLYDQNSTIVNLEAFLHRHRIVIVFFDGQAGPEANETLVTLREFHAALKAESIIVLGVSTALPQDIRNNSSQPFPFPILSDVAATASESVHRKWGCFVEPPSLDKPAGTQPGVFLIDRTGMVPWHGSHPRPESDTSAIVAHLLGGG